VDDLNEAVQSAREEAAPGTTVLFSPGTSSFDMFRDYVERGESFRRLIAESNVAGAGSFPSKVPPTTPRKN
jgi:UDP-N-acetylmuramoylalanine--D-glutamate ligase